MRRYRVASEEALRTSRLLDQWTEDGLLFTEQRQSLTLEAASELRTTNIFLRIVLFLFTSVCLWAGVGLLCLLLSYHGNIIFLVCALVSYLGAEYVVSEECFYHHGIEEALAVCSVLLLYGGLHFSHRYSLPASHPAEVLCPAACLALSLWIWQRFSLWYAFPAAMIITVFVPGYWTSSLVQQRLILVFFYAIGLTGVALIRSAYRFDYLDKVYSLAEAFLWFGIYLAITLKLLAWNRPRSTWSGGQHASIGFPAWFYWLTWILIWTLPFVILLRGIRRRDRRVIAVGAITTILTFIANNPYLNWQRHSWDPMILGIVLGCTALSVRRWLQNGPGGVRHGFTALSLTGKDLHTLGLGSALLGVATGQSSAHHLQTNVQDLQAGNGESGGGGATRGY